MLSLVGTLWVVPRQGAFDALNVRSGGSGGFGRQAGRDAAAARQAVGRRLVLHRFTCQVGRPVVGRGPWWLGVVGWLGMLGVAR